MFTSIRTHTVAETCALLMAAKNQRAELDQHIAGLESALAAKFELPDEGQSTRRQDSFQIIFKAGYNYKFATGIDLAQGVLNGVIPENLTKLCINDTAAKHLRTNAMKGIAPDTDTYADLVLANLLIVTPAKLGVTVTRTI